MSTAMADSTHQRIATRLTAKLADSIAAPPIAATRRSVHGATSLPGKATAVIGMRRAGKTTFLHQVRADWLGRGVGASRIPYINFEDEQLDGITAADLGSLVEEHYRRYPQLRGQQSVLWSLDEIQVVPGWERFVRRLLDSETVEVFLSGSSAALLSREIATAMRGRAWEVVIHPFSFEEHLRHHQRAAPSHPDFMSAAERSALERDFLQFLESGGFPEAQGLDTSTRQRLLSDYVDVAMMRDVVERHAVSNVAGLRWLVRHLLGNPAGMFSVERFYAALRSQGIAIAKDTVHQLLLHLEDCFLVRTVWLESESERRRMVHPRKAYPVDTGLIPIYDRSGRANLGHALETAVLLELERRHASVTYVRTREGHEVDFLARTADSQELIQVCADARAPDVAERELRALTEAAREHPRAKCRLLTLTQDALPSELPKSILAQPAYEWMLLS